MKAVGSAGGPHVPPSLHNRIAFITGVSRRRERANC